MLSLEAQMGIFLTMSTTMKMLNHGLITMVRLRKTFGMPLPIGRKDRIVKMLL